MPDGSKAGVVGGPATGYLLNKGGLSIKRNGLRNLWGSLGDTMLILGRFTAAPAPAAPSARTAGEGTRDGDVSTVGVGS